MLKRKSKLTLAIIINIVLLMTLYINSVNAASTVKGDNFDYDEATLNKYIINEDAENNMYDIVLEIEGKNAAEVPPTDIVLAVDESTSMTGEKFEQAKNAVIEFADKMLSKSENVKMGYVGFSSKVNETKILPLTHDQETYKNFIRDNAGLSGGATHIQAGLVAAKDILAQTPDSNQKIIIILSDGVPTLSYQATDVTSLASDEIKSYGYKEPTYKVTDFDYTKTVGSGTKYSLSEDSYKVGGTLVTSHGESTISEILDFKKETNHTIYSVGIGVKDTAPSEEGYSLTEEKINAQVGNQVYTSSWNETIKNGIYDPNETISVTTEFTNTAGFNVSAQVKSNVVQDNDWRVLYARTRDYVQDSQDTYQKIYLDGVEVKNHGFNDIMTQATLSTPYTISVPPGSTYKVETQFKLKDFTSIATDDNRIKEMSLAEYNIRLISATGSYSTYVYAYDGGYGGPVFDYHSEYAAGQQGEFVLKNLSSDGIEGSTYYNLASIDKLTGVLNDLLYTKMTDSIINGVVTDPMGKEFIEFQKGAFEGQDYKIWAETDGVQDDTLLEGVTVQYNESTKSLVASGLNLSAGEKVYIQYRVKLDIAGEGFDSEKWYATNDKATLLPYEGGEERAFPEPMVKEGKAVVEEPKEELPEGTKEEPEAAAVKTGDSASTGILTVLLMISTASLVLLLKKNEEDN